jgi:hypothetical protein
MNMILAAAVCSCRVLGLLETACEWKDTEKFSVEASTRKEAEKARQAAKSGHILRDVERVRI